MAKRASQIVVGIDLGGTKIAGAAADRDGNLLSRQVVRTAAEAGPEGVVTQIASLVESLATAAGSRVSAIARVGLGAPGPTDSEDGLVFEAPNLPGWRDVPLRRLLEQQIGRPVHVDNDANAAAIAEHLWGAGEGVSDMVFLTISTGIGGGLILGGRLYHGAAGTAGELGHISIDAGGPLCRCGNRGCLEMVASGTAIARHAVTEISAGARSLISSLVGGDLAKVTAITVEQAARRGDPLAQAVIVQAAEYLGVGLSDLANLLAPRLVVIGGGVAQAGDLIFEPARRVLRERAFHRPAEILEVTASQLGQYAGLMGAVALALGYDGIAAVPIGARRPGAEVVRSLEATQPKAS